MLVPGVSNHTDHPDFEDGAAGSCDACLPCKKCDSFFSIQSFRGAGCELVVKVAIMIATTRIYCELPKVMASCTANRWQGFVVALRTLVTSIFHTLHPGWQLQDLGGPLKIST